MSLYVHYELNCDADGCFASYWSDIDEVNSRALSVAGAKKAGWVHRAARDFCPKHTLTGALIKIAAPDERRNSDLSV